MPNQDNEFVTLKRRLKNAFLEMIIINASITRRDSARRGNDDLLGKILDATSLEVKTEAQKQASALIIQKFNLINDTTINNNEQRVTKSALGEAFFEAIADTVQGKIDEIKTLSRNRLYGAIGASVCGAVGLSFLGLAPTIDPRFVFGIYGSGALSGVHGLLAMRSHVRMKELSRQLGEIPRVREEIKEVMFELANPSNLRPNALAFLQKHVAEHPTITSDIVLAGTAANPLQTPANPLQTPALVPSTSPSQLQPPSQPPSQPQSPSRS